MTHDEPMFAEERQRKIVAELRRRNKLLVTELCAEFGVSSATIRNDLNQLEKQGLLKRTHGGAISGTKAGFEPTSVQKSELNRPQKERIACRAAQLIEDGDTVAIDTGTTALCLAQQLADKSHVTVVTSDIRIACLLEEYAGITVVLAGGALRRGFSCTVGAMTNAALRSLRVDKAFLATNAVNAAGELCTPDMEQAQVKKTLMEMASSVVLICDSSKFGTESFAKFATLSEVDTLVTDDGLDAETRSRLESVPVEVIVC